MKAYLLFRLCIRHALKWASFSVVEEEFKQAVDMPKLIELIFKQYGKTFTSYGLALVTAAKEGISTNELEDICLFSTSFVIVIFISITFFSFL